VVSDSLAYPDVFVALQAAEAALGRPVNPTVMTATEWRRKRKQPGSFAARLHDEPRLFIFGSDDDLA
jgi:hypothetical protein